MRSNGAQKQSSNGTIKVIFVFWTLFIVFVVYNFVWDTTVAEYEQLEQPDDSTQRVASQENGISDPNEAEQQILIPDINSSQNIENSPKIWPKLKQTKKQPSKMSEELTPNKMTLNWSQIANHLSKKRTCFVGMVHNSNRSIIYLLNQIAWMAENVLNNSCLIIVESNSNDNTRFIVQEWMYKFASRHNNSDIITSLKDYRSNNDEKRLLYTDRITVQFSNWRTFCVELINDQFISSVLEKYSEILDKGVYPIPKQLYNTYFPFEWKEIFKNILRNKTQDEESISSAKEDKQEKQEKQEKLKTKIAAKQEHEKKWCIF